MAAALSSLVIALKEAPQQGWAAWPIVALFAGSLGCGTLFVRRTLRSPCPLVDLRALKDSSFALGTALSFILGIGLYGAVYLMPVFLAFVRVHDPLEIGETMMVTGAAQLVMAPIAVFLERRMSARVLTGVGFALFALGLALSAFQTRATDFEEMVLPQILRGVAIMLCLLPPIRIALGHLSPEAVANASGLFNLMRNLGGAIGLALIDTVLYGRGPAIGERLGQAIARGDVAAARRSDCRWISFLRTSPALKCRRPPWRLSGRRSSVRPLWKPSTKPGRSSQHSASPAPWPCSSFGPASGAVIASIDALRRSEASEDCHRRAENPCFGRLGTVARLEGGENQISTKTFSARYRLHQSSLAGQ